MFSFQNGKYRNVLNAKEWSAQPWRKREFPTLIQQFVLNLLQRQFNIKCESRLFNTGANISKIVCYYSIYGKQQETCILSSIFQQVLYYITKLVYPQIVKLNSQKSLKKRFIIQQKKNPSTLLHTGILIKKFKKICFSVLLCIL